MVEMSLHLIRLKMYLQIFIVSMTLYNPIFALAHSFMRSHPLSNKLHGENMGQGLPYLGLPFSANSPNYHHPPGIHFTDLLKLELRYLTYLVFKSTFEKQASKLSDLDLLQPWPGLYLSIS